MSLIIPNILNILIDSKMTIFEDVDSHVISILTSLITSVVSVSNNKKSFKKLSFEMTVES